MPLVTAAGRLAALAALAFAPSFAASAASAHDVTVGALVIRHPWARATPGGAEVGGGYLTVDNRGTAPDRLMGGTFAASNGFSLHSMTMDGGVMRMRPTGPLEVPAGGSISLDPAGRHIMFTGLKRGLKRGETVPGTLVFEHAGTVAVEFDVAGIGAKGPGTDATGGGGAPAAQGHGTHDGHAMPGMDMD